MNDLMSFGIHRIWKKSFINWLNPQKNRKLIDVASISGCDFVKFQKRNPDVCVPEDQKYKRRDR